MLKHPILIIYSFAFLFFNFLLFIFNFLFLILILIILISIYIPILIIDLKFSTKDNSFYYVGFFLAIFFYIFSWVFFYITDFMIWGNMILLTIMAPFLIYFIKRIIYIIKGAILSRSEKKDIKNQKRLTQRQELLAKYTIVEDLIQEKNFSNAIIELNNILNEAKIHKFREIYNWANEKLTLCENFEKDLKTFEKSIPMIKKIIQEKISIY